MSKGNSASPTALRVCRPALPNTSTRRSEQPSMTAGVWLNPGATLTIPKTLTIRSIRSKSPSSACSVARIDNAVTRFLSLFQRQVRAHFPPDDLRTRNRPMTADVHHVVDDDAGEVIAGWRENRGKFNTQFEETIPDHRVSVQGALLRSSSFSLRASIAVTPLFGLGHGRGGGGRRRRGCR